jgi:hypothetical protein
MMNKTSAIMTLLVWQFGKQIAKLATIILWKISGCYLITKSTFYTEDKYTSVITREMQNSLYMT